MPTFTPANEGSRRMASIALLDDYQNVALSMADWSALQAAHRIQVFNERIGDVDALARASAPRFPAPFSKSCRTSSCW
jgi:hypothetical protein